MPRFLADKSALARSQTRPEVREALDVLLRRNEVAVCAIVELEVLYSATSPDHYRSTADALGGLPRIDIDEGTMRRALEVQATLAARAEHRSVTLPDLLIAACAERAGLTVLHYDADFDRISGLTGQATRWVVPRGSVS